jgi:hypothetical protein
MVSSLLLQWATSFQATGWSELNTRIKWPITSICFLAPSIVIEVHTESGNSVWDLKWWPTRKLLVTLRNIKISTSCMRLTFRTTTWISLFSTRWLCDIEFEQLQICKQCNDLIFCKVYPIEEQSKMWWKNLQYTAQDYLKQLNMSYN